MRYSARGVRLSTVVAQQKDSVMPLIVPQNIRVNCCRLPISTLSSDVDDNWRCSS